MIPGRLILLVDFLFWETGRRNKNQRVSPFLRLGVHEESRNDKAARW